MSKQRNSILFSDSKCYQQYHAKMVACALFVLIQGNNLDYDLPELGNANSAVEEGKRGHADRLLVTKLHVRQKKRLR